MQTFLVEHNVLFALICGLLAVAYGAYLTRWVLQQSPGNERMREIQAAIQEGASAYLNRQYRTVGVVAVVVAALLLIAGIWSDDLGWKVALGFIIGAVLSALAGYVGMNTAVRANARVAEAGRTGLSEAFDIAFKGGTVTGILSSASACWASPATTAPCASATSRRPRPCTRSWASPSAAP